jgi:hypothetical protein
MKSIRFVLMAPIISMCLVAPALAAPHQTAAPQFDHALVFKTENVAGQEPRFATLSSEEMKESEGAIAPIVGRIVVGAAVGAIGGAIKSYAEDGEVDWRDVGTGAVIGAVGGVGGWVVKYFGW